MKFNRAGQNWLLAIIILYLFVLTACCKTKMVVLPESKVQKMQKGESANFDGFLLTSGAAAKLLEAAESCKAKVKP